MSRCLFIPQLAGVSDGLFLIPTLPMSTRNLRKTLTQLHISQKRSRVRWRGAVIGIAQQHEVKGGRTFVCGDAAMDALSSRHFSPEEDDESLPLLALRLAQTIYR